MSFNKVEDFLGIPLDPMQLAQFQEWENYLNKIVYFGGEIFCEILNTQDLGKEDSAPVIMFYRKSLELVGAISALIINFYSEPAKIILRTLLEITLYIEYITEENISQRSLSFLICQFHEKLNRYKKYDCKAQQGDQFRKQLRNDQYFSNFEFRNEKLLKEQINNLESLINSTFYSEVEKEYQRLKVEHSKRKPVWYQFFDGPKSVEGLAYYFKLGSFYEVIYRNYSQGTHGVDIIDGYIRESKEEGKTDFLQIRYPFSAKFVCLHAITFSLMNCQNLIKHRLPNWINRYDEFYSTHIKSFYMWLKESL